MAVTLACIAGDDIYRQWDAGSLIGEPLGPQNTPFGESGGVFHIQPPDGEPLYMLARTGGGMDAAAPHNINYRANIYALKDLGVDCILGWGSGRAITHTIAVGDLVLLSDVIDQTARRTVTFFEDSPLGQLRQLPVFCPTLRSLAGELLDEMKLVYHPSGIAAVREGPRGETPAEVRMLSNVGADIVTHEFLPEPFLARELQMPYAAVCRVANYAETGSQHRPFATGELFVGMADSESQRISAAMAAMSRVTARLATRLASQRDIASPFRTAQQEHIDAYNLPDDWREWFEHR